MRLPVALVALCLTVAPDANGEERIDINTATLEELDRLPGIGPTKAQAILDSRKKDGRFSTVQQLDRVKGIGPATLKKLAPLVTVGQARPAPVVPKKRIAPKKQPRKQPEPPPTPVVRIDPALDRESPEGKLNLNVATRHDLRQLNGVSEASAKVIVAWRAVKGPYESITELANVPGLPVEVLETVQYFVTTRVDVATLKPAVLTALEISEKSARAVLEARDRKRLRNAGDLERLDVLTTKERVRLTKLLWF